MLSDEEKQAIEYLKRHIIPCYGRKGTIEFILNDTLLNLIEKQSKEIEELKEENRKKSIVIIEYQDLYEKLEDKIKAKIEEWQKEKEFYDKDEDREWGQYNNWDWVDTIINEMQSLLEKE